MDVVAVAVGAFIFVADCRRCHVLILSPGLFWIVALESLPSRPLGSSTAPYLWSCGVVGIMIFEIYKRRSCFGAALCLFDGVVGRSPSVPR